MRRTLRKSGLMDSGTTVETHLPDLTGAPSHYEAILGELSQASRFAKQLLFQY